MSANNTRIILEHVGPAGSCWRTWDVLDHAGAHEMNWILIMIESWACMITLDSCRSIYIGASWCISFLYANMEIELCFGYLVLRSMFALSLIYALSFNIYFSWLITMKSCYYELIILWMWVSWFFQSLTTILPRLDLILTECVLFMYLY